MTLAALKMVKLTAGTWRQGCYEVLSRWQQRSTIISKYKLSPSLRQAAASIKKQQNLATTRCKFDDLVRVLGHAWVGSPTRAGEPLKAWLTSHVNYPNKQDQLDISQYYMGIAVTQALRDGALVIGVNDSSSELAAVVLLSEKQSSDNEQVASSSTGSIDSLKSSISVYWSDWLWEMNVTLRLWQLPIPKLLMQSSAYQLQQETSALKSTAWFNLQQAYTTSMVTTATIKQKHWSIDMIAACPLLQGKGHGDALLRLVCNLADQAQQSIQLEAAGPAQVKWYQRYGFTTLHVHKLNDPTNSLLNIRAPLVVTLMTRSPKVLL